MTLQSNFKGGINLILKSVSVWHLAGKNAGVTSAKQLHKLELLKQTIDNAEQMKL